MQSLYTKIKKSLPFIALTFFALGFVFFFYGKVLIHADNYLFTNSGDGIKNYYTYAYHISRDSSYLDFEGMNYPYGEHFLYTDCHPLLANSFKFLSTQFPFFENHSIGILNFLMIFGILLTFFICYLLLCELKLQKWFALIFAISITLLAPQIFRMEGHLSLSYSFAFPLSWWLLIRFYKTPGSALYTGLIFLNNLFWLFIHAYLGVIILFFLIMLVLFEFIFNKEKRKHIWVFIKASLVVMLPLIAFYLFNTLTDTHIGRTDNPSGFFLYNAEVDDIFVPHHPPLRPLLDRLSGNAISLKWEAWTYVGLAAGLTFLILLISMLWGLVWKSARNTVGVYFQNKSLNISLLAATVVLLFAMGLPFKQFPALLDWFPIIKQFRATGRFTWPFYFVFMAFIAWVIQTWVLKKSRPKLYYLLPLVILVFNLVEAIPYHRAVSKHISSSPNLFDYDQLPDSFKEAIQATDPKDYQALITFPFYYYGSESFGRPRDDEAVRSSLIFSFHTGIPNVCANLTRTPIPDSKKIVQLLSPSFYPKEILPDFPNHKPFLLMQTREQLSKYENTWLSKSKLIAEYDDFSLYELPYSELEKNNAGELIDYYSKIKSQLYAKDGFLLSDSSTLIYYNDFENKSSDRPFRGSGGFQGVKKGKNTFAELGPGNFETGKTYHFSFWMYNGQKDALNLWFRFLVEEYDPKANTWHTTTIFPDQSEVIFGNWSLVEGEFRVRSADNFIYFVSKGKENSKALLFADDLLIQESGTDVYLLDADTLFFNNHRVIKPAN